jgi:3,4-dihydroxy-9,10-secoandrosta-1,3,5(10)-triene-9,17-dione 4,5-dioxygenase
MDIRGLGYVVIETADPARWDAYLTALVGGMAAGEDGNGNALYRIDSRPFRFVIQKGSEEAFRVAGWEAVDEPAFERLVDRLERDGREVKRLDPELRQAKGLVRCEDPAGHAFELSHGIHATITRFESAAGVSQFVTGPKGGLGMGHIVYAAPNFDECHYFYREVMGFADTDLPSFDLGMDGVPPMNAAFMHAASGRHHSVAIMTMPPTPAGCVHIMVEAATMDDVGRAYDRMLAADVPVSATLGRHVNDEMTSFYVQTPGGFDLEFGCGGLVVDPESWEATAHTKISEWGHEWAWQKAMKAGA